MSEALQQRSPIPFTDNVYMLHISDLLLQHREVETFEALIEVVKLRAKDERFFRMDIKPPYPDTPDNWEMLLEAAFSSANEVTPIIRTSDQ